MARNLTAGFIAAATSGSCRPIVLVEAAFASSTLRVWNGFGDLSWDGQTWNGNGWFQSMEGGDETTQVEAVDMTIVLSGVPASVLSLALGDEKQGASGKIYIGFLDSSGAVVPDPYLWWQGTYSHAEIDYAPDNPVVRLVYDTPLSDLERPRELRWTHDAQQAIFSGDLGFQYVKAAANWHGTWGGQKKKLDKKNSRTSDKNGRNGGSSGKNKTRVPEL